jgi:hypothetical protein
MSEIFFRTVATIFGLLSFGSILESFKIMTSSAPDIAPQRTYLTLML